MNIRDAILKAADHIERNPADFDYQKNHLPECGTPGCAIGWIAYFREIRGPFCASQTKDSIRAIGISWGHGEDSFIDRMDGLCNGDWREVAQDCADTLRLYADKYHPAAPVLYPNWSAIAAQQTVPADAVSEEIRV